MYPILRLLPCAVLAAGILASSCVSQKKPDGAAPPDAASSGDGASSQDVGNRLDDSHLFEDPLNIKNLTVWPIIAEKIRELGEFLTLGEAQTQGVAVVKEVGVEGERERGRNSATATHPSRSAADPHEGAPAATTTGDATPTQQQLQLVCTDPAILASTGAGASVNTLVIENKGDLPILVCGGTIVKGGRQDRQIAQDFVIAPKSSTPVDAFCIEAHRWTESRDGEETRGVFTCMPAVALQKVRASAQYASSQHEVWANVSYCNAAAGKSPATATLLATIEETDKDALARRTELEKAVRRHFEALRAKGRAPVGFAYAVNGKPVTVRTFAHPRVFEGQFEPFVKSMCIEADLASRETKPATQPCLKDVLELVRSINQEKEQVSATSASNRNGRRMNDKGGNLNCYIESPAAGGALVPLTQDWTSKN